MGSLYPISTITVPVGGQLNVEFTSIPQTYTHLLLLCSMASERTAGTADDILVRFNGTTSGYTNKALLGSVNTLTGYTYTDSGTLFDVLGGSQFTNKYSNIEILIPNYTNSQYKQILFDTALPSDVTSQYCAVGSGTLANTAPVTSIKMYGYTGLDITQYSKATLYGIRDN